MGTPNRRKWLWIAGVTLLVAQLMGYFGRELFAALVLFTVLFVVLMVFAAVFKALHLAWSALMGRVDAVDVGRAFSRTRFLRPRLWTDRLSHPLRQTPGTQP